MSESLTNTSLWRRTLTCSFATMSALTFISSPCHGADHVIHISVDGLRPSYLQPRIDAGAAPNFKRFLDEGAWTNNARTDFTHSITLPNHTSMVTGRPVSLPTGMSAMTQHGYTDNGDPAPTTTLHNFTNPDWYKASTFDVVHDAGFSTAMYASKFKFIIYEQSYNAANGAPHANGSDKINVYYGPESTASMQSQLLSNLAANDFKYTFVHYADLDDAGHGAGWGSATYNTAITTVDGYLGQLFNLIQTDTNLAGRTAVVLSADHGGTGTGHSNAADSLNYTIPFYVWGAGVGHGDLYSFNSDTRTNPSTSRPDYVVSGQPIRNGDGGNLALKLLGLGPIPGSLINVAQTLRVTTPGDFNANNVVDAADYVSWRNGAGAYTPDTYDTWRSQFGQTPGGLGFASGESAVPEPATAMLWPTALVCLFALRRARCANAA
jgi:hypothetical protein